MKQKIILSILILTALCACGTITVLAGFFFFTPAQQIGSSSPVEETMEPEDPQAAVQTPQPLDRPIPPASSPVDANNLPAELTTQMDQIQQQVIAIRGLQAKNPVIRDLLTSSELQQKVRTDFFKDYSAQDARDDELLLTTLGMIPDGFDLLDLYHRLYAEQVAGYYDSDTKEMFVVQGATFGGIERMTYAHEYTHTLQDQNYDLKNGMKLDDEYCKVNSEYCSAVTALVEGDATFTEQDWMLTSASQQDRQDMEDFYSTYSSPVYDSAPEYLQADMLFPYHKGLEFVYSLKDRGGYELVNQAFLDPPVTTEQIIHPDKYPSEKPVSVDLPDNGKVLPEGWIKVETNQIGEWYTYMILAKGQDTKYQLLDSIAKKASAGWGGDRYSLYTDPQYEKVVFLLRSTWDTQKDADEFYLAIKEYGQERWGNASLIGGKTLNWNSVKEGQVLVKQAGRDTLWLIAPDTGTQSAILSTLPEFK